MILLESIKNGAYSEYSKYKYTGIEYTITNVSGNYIFTPVAFHSIRIYSNGAELSYARPENVDGIRSFKSSGLEISPAVNKRSFLIDGVSFLESDIIKIRMIIDPAYIYSGNLLDHFTTELKDLADDNSYVIIPNIYSYNQNNISDITYIDLSARIAIYIYDYFKDSPQNIHPDAIDYFDKLYTGDYFSEPSKTHALREMDYIQANYDYRDLFTTGYNMLVKYNHNDLKNRDIFSIENVAYIDELTDSISGLKRFDNYPTI